MSVKLLKAVITIVFLSLPFSFPLSAATVTWTGAISSDWDTAGNWDSGSEPTAADDVIIPNSLIDYPTISSTGNTVKSVHIQAGTPSLNISTSGELTVQNSAGTGLVNEGNLTIDGTLNITGSTFSGVSNIGDVSINGTLNISDTQGFSGFDHAPDATSTVINNGTLHITDSNNSGLRCSKAFENNGTIIIDGTHPEVALFSSNSFVNTGKITIDVDNHPTDGSIFNSFNNFNNNSCALITANKEINHTGTSFTNDGTIVLISTNDNTGTILNDGIINKANPDVVLLTTGSGVVYNNLTTNVWTTCGGDNDWDKAENWSLAIEPISTHEVIIPNGLTDYPVVGSSGNTVQSVTIETNASLEIGPGDDELTILNSPNMGLYSEGVVIILGTLNIIDSGGSGLVNVGELTVHANATLEVTGTLGPVAIDNTNAATKMTNMGILKITDSGSEGLVNASEFINTREINIDGSYTGTALSNDGTFDNYSSITISVSNFPEGGGMLNSGTFNNDACSRVTTNRKIDNSLGTFDNKGIVILNGTNDNLGSFINDGLMYNPNSAALTTTGTGVVYTNLTTLVWTGCQGTTDWDTKENWSLEIEPDAAYDVVVTNQMGASSTEPVVVSTSANAAKSVEVLATGNLQIETTGVLSISNSVTHGLYIKPFGAFANEGTLSISNSSNDGIRNEGTNITNPGEINITDSGDDGFYNGINGSFNNSGTINIEGTQSESGIDNNAIFTNEGDLNIITSNSPTNGSIDNSGTFNNNACANLTVNNEIDNSGAIAFNNSGVLESTFNGVNAGTIVNHGVIYNTNGGTFTTSGLSNGFEFVDFLTTVWTNCSGANTDWGNDDNWSNVTPTGLIDAIIPAGVSFYPIITSPSDVDVMTIEVGAEVTNQSTFNAQIIDNNGHLINDACESVINISSELNNNAGGEITNTGSIILLGTAEFNENGGLYTGNAVGSSPPSILYVDMDATLGNNNGSSWENAYTDLQDALMNITCPVEIWVAEGGYFPTNLTDRSISFNIPDGVELYGGFKGNETLRSDRDLVNSIVILSGDIGVDNDDTDNSFQVVRVGEDKVVKIDGFTIADGNANEIGGGAVQNDGGGIFNLGEASIQNCIFINNRATDKGAALYNDNDNTRIVNCIFRANIGDAIYNDNCNLSLINTLISGNDGNGINHTGTASVQILDLDNCTIAGNDGHGVYIDETSLNAVNSIFWDNEVGEMQDEVAQISTTTFATVSYSCVEGGWSGSGSTNISTNPLFITAIDPTDSPTMLGNFHLQLASPAINAGNNGSLQTDTSDVDDDGNNTEIIDIDLDNNTRIQLTTLDMGAYESSESCSVDGTNAYWTGDASTEWNNAANWCPTFLPNASDNVFIGTVISGNYPQLNSNQTVKSVLVEENASLTIGNIGTSLLTIDGGSNGMVIEENGTLTLNSSGALNIVNSTNDGIENQGTVTIEGSLIINNSTDREIYNYGTFNIELGGNVQITSNGNHGIFNALNGTFTNDGNLTVAHTSAGTGIENTNNAIFQNDNIALITTMGTGTGSSIVNSLEAEFANSACATLTANGKIISNTTFSNDGFLITTFNGTHTISGTFTNNGAISDEFNAFNSFTGITNNSLLVEPITICSGGSLVNPLIDGGTTLDIGEDWLHPLSEGFGGTYNNANNTFTPSLGVGTHELLIPIDNSFLECTEHLPIKVTIEGCSLQWTGGSDPANTDWNDPTNWSTGIVPTSTDDVVITDIAPLTNYPIIGVNIEVGSLTVNLNANLEVAASGNLTIADGLTNNGTCTNNGSVELSVGNLNNNGTFFNQACAVLDLEELIRNAGMFTNNGILHSNTTVSHENIIGDAVFTNTGILYNKGMASPFITGGLVNDTGRTLNDTDTNIWTGCNNDSDWNNPSNWSLGIVPTLKGIIIPDISPSTNYPQITSTENSITSLLIENGGELTVENGGDLTIQNIVDTGIDIEDGATLTIDLGGLVNVVDAPIVGVNVDGTLTVNGDLTISSTSIGMNVGATGVVIDEGLIQIGEGVSLEKTGVISVVNFLEIQNGSTFEVKAGGSLIIDGTAAGGAEKKLLSDGDTGIKIFTGGTLLSEATGTIEIINLSGTGIDNAGEVDHSGDMTITAEDTGITTSNLFTDSGSIDISKPEGLLFAAKTTGGASVVNFLEIQNGSTFEIASGGSLTIDGSDVGPSMKSGVVNDDTGIDVKTGGTFTTEANTTIEVINMSGLSTGIINNGEIENAGNVNITIESTGVQVQSGTVENSGNITISKIDGLSFAAKKEGAVSVVNFLEIQNGSTFEMLSGGSLVIDGSDTGAALKSGLLSNDTGIDIDSGGALIIETNSTVDVLNMLVGSKGIVNGGDIDNTGTTTITTENLGLQVQTGGTVDNDGTINISKVVTTGVDIIENIEEGEGQADADLPSSLSKKGGISVVNFLEIQNGSTFEVLAGGSLIIDGQEEGAALKSGTKKALLNDTGIKVNTGGTFIAHPTSNVDVINMIGASIGVSTSGTTTNDGDFEITTEGRGVEVIEGTFDNGGDLEISKIEGLTLLGAKKGSGSVVNFLEIQNGSTFEVKSGGSLLIDGQSTLSKSATNFSNDTGITVQSGGTFDAKTNSTVDVLNMIGTSTGVVNSGEIFDGGDFTITTENIGMQVDANTVQVTGTLTITTVDAPAKSLGKKGAISVVNFLEIQNGSTFEVLSGGTVTVDGGAGLAKSSGLLNDIGVIIDLGGELITEEQALFLIKNFSGEESVGMRNNGLVDNSGTVEIEEVDGNGLENNQDFNNSDCAVFITDSKVNNSTNGDISNNGLISSTYGENGGKHENDGSIVNQGVIEDPNNAFVNIIGNPVIELGDGSTNTYTLFNSLTTCFGQNIDNATNKPLDTGGLFNIHMWYTDITLTQIAAVYIGSSNTLIPLFGVLGPGTHTLYVSVSSDKFSDCGATNVVLVELTILPLPEIIPIDQGICIGDQTMSEPLAVEDMGDEYIWYDAETDGSMLTTGTSYAPDPLPTTTTTYWVEAIGENCSSEVRTAVTLTVHDLPETPTITSPTDFEFCQNETTIIDAGVYDANHSYTWSTTETTQTISVGIEQAYTVTITNENGCTSTASAGASMAELPKIEDDMGFCFGGFSVLDAGTYSSNDTYSWSTGSTTQTIEIEDAGIYTVTVTNAINCVATATTEVALENCCFAIAGTLTVVTEELCAGDDIVVSTNGTEEAPLGYEQYYLLVNKTSGKIEAVNTTGIFSGIDADDYDLYSYVELSAMPPIPSPVGSSNMMVTAIGETDEGCFDISEPETAIMPAEPAAEVVFSNTNGPTGTITIATITITGGTLPYNTDFSYSGGTATFLNNFATGVYTVSSWGNATWDLTITDDNGCESDAWILSAEDNPTMMITSETITKETCVNDEDGAIEITVSGGILCTPGPDYTYSWTGPNSFTATTEDITGLASGLYYVTISDCGGGTLEEDFHVQRQTLSRRRGRSNIGCGGTSNKADLTETDIGEAFLKVHPNPFSQYTTIEFGVSETALTNITLYTLDGRKVREIQSSLVESDTSQTIHFEAGDIQPGMYLLQLISENGEMVMEKLIIR